MSGYKPPHLRGSGGSAPPSAAPRTQGGFGDRGGSSFGDRAPSYGDRYGDQQSDRRGAGIGPRGGSSSSLDRDGTDMRAYHASARISKSQKFNYTVELGAFEYKLNHRLGLVSR